MAIEFDCPSCGQRLRLADEHAGKIARCPQCQTETTAPWVSGPAPSSREPSEPSSEATRAFELFGSAFSAGAAGGEQSNNPYATPPSSPYRRYPKESRGQAITILAVMSFVSCFACPPSGLVMAAIAWAMAQQDLADIQLGLVDPNSEGAVRMGRALAIVNVVLWGLGIALFVGMFTLAIVVDLAK